MTGSAWLQAAELEGLKTHASATPVSSDVQNIELIYSCFSALANNYFETNK